MKKIFALPASAKSVFSLTKTGFLILFLTQLSFAQIVIEERVEILPQNVILPETPAGEHTIRVDIQWSPASLRGWILYYNLQCDQNNYSSTPSTSGSNTYSLTSTGYENYNIQFRFGYLDPNQPTITGTYQLYYDEQLIRSQSFQAQPATYSSYAYFNTHYQSPVFNDYTFNIGPASLCFGNGTTQGFTLGHGCTSFEIDTSSEMVNLQILNGGEFASFYGYQGTITDNLTIPYSELNSVELKQDQFFSGSPTTVLVQSNIGGLIKQESIMAHPKSSYGINASTFDYPILYGETKYTEVKPTGPGGCTAIFPPEIKLNALITVGDDLGHLIDFDYGTEGDTLTNITFNSFGGNHIGFISDGVKKDIADTAIVTFSTSDAEIGMKQVAIIINPSPIYVAIEPENVAPGDTALIIIKSRQEDGTLIDFPGWQTFEVKMIEGCNLGKILAVGDTARYFYDVPQPIKFIADSLAGGTVGLIVGLVEEIIGTRPVQENDVDKIEEAAKEKQNKLIGEKTKKEVNENPALNPGAEFCPIEEIQSFTIEEFDFVVGDECDKYKDRPPGLEYIDDNVYHINQLGNNENCDPNSEENKLAGGKLETTINKPILSGWEFSPRKSIIEMKFTFDWSYCTDIIMQNFTKAKFIELDPTSNMYKIYNPTENSYRDINGPGEARKIISAFMSIQFSDKMKIPENLEYYPLPVTKKHELEHVEQHKKEIFINYFTALYLVNHRQPQPNDWCKLSPEEQSRLYDSEDEWYKSTVQKAYDKTLNNLKDETVTKLNEIGAQAVSYFYLKSELIPGIKAQFHLP